MTTVYLVRHSEPFRDLEGETKSRDSLLLINEKYILGVRGEKLAEKVANNPEFDNIDVVWVDNINESEVTLWHVFWFPQLRL